MLARLYLGGEGEDAGKKGSHSPQETIAAAAAEGSGVRNHPEPGKHFQPGWQRPEGQHGGAHVSHQV